MKLDCAMGEDNSANKLMVSRYVKRHEEIVTKTFEIVNEGLRMSSESLIKEGTEFQDIPIVPTANCGSGFLFKLGQDNDDMETSRCASGYNSDRVKAVGCETEVQFPGTLASNDVFLKTCKYRDEGTSKNPAVWIHSHSYGKDSTSAASKCLLESFVKSSSDTGSFIFKRERSEFDQGKTSVRSFNGRSALISSNQLTDAKLRLGEREYHQYHEVDGHSRPRNSVTVCFRESNTSSFFDPPSMSSHHFSALGGEWFQEMQKFSGFRLLPSHLDTSEKTEVKKSLYDCYSLQKVPKCTHNVETMRICTNVDSVLDPGASRPMFCHAIHGLRITKKTDVNIENDKFRSTRILSDTPCDLCSLSPLIYGQGKRGLKIQSLSNFTNSESKGHYVKDSEVTAKNAPVQEKDPLSGATSTPSKKVINMDCNSSRQTSVAFSTHAKFKRPNTELPDLNLDLRPLPATVTSSENGDPPSSRTQSLEMDILLTHAKQPKHQSSPSLDDSPVANPGNRLVKRLKLSSLHSAQGTESSSKDETSFQEKLNDNFGSIPGSAVISSEKPTFRKPQGKDYLSVNPSEKDLGLLLSHAWIQRWQHNGSSSTKNKSSTKMFCDPQSSNLTLKGLQNKQFPSIAAMALMGRAMSVFQPCELQKRGSFTVWNAKASQKHD
ncbi:uncharacterized protein [Primulina huaijiensis]|uniref:uncharacterized protein n=1 Tax=Primulina huaijiensis TaxID=1492673 RepID=UPI003CC6E4E6